jgi:hypothetical protein
VKELLPITKNLSAMLLFPSLQPAAERIEIERGGFHFRARLAM